MLHPPKVSSCFYTPFILAPAEGFGRLLARILWPLGRFSTAFEIKFPLAILEGVHFLNCLDWMSVA